AALLRKHDVEDDHIVGNIPRCAESLFPVARHLHDMFLEFEAVAKGNGHRGIVFHDENSAHAASGCGTFVIGKTMVKVLPWPGTLLTSTPPPCAWTTCITIARPRPLPL